MSTHSSHSHSADHAEGHHEDHPSGVGKFVAVFVALCVLTAISFAAGSSTMIMSNRAVGWTIMMAVSCAKALLVMLFFMHLLWEANWKYVLTIPASVMSIFLLLMLFPDVKMRTTRYSEERWLYAATPEKAAPHDAGHEGDEATKKAEPAH
jgi:cytochrome c oxidase subunit 4